MLSTSPFYNKARVGLGANGYGANSFLIAPLIGAVLAAGAHMLFYPPPEARPAADGQAPGTSAPRHASYGAQPSPAGGATSTASRATQGRPGEPAEPGHPAPGPSEDQGVAGRLRQLLRRLSGLIRSCRAGPAWNAGGVADRHFADPRLTGLYELWDPPEGEDDFRFYLPVGETDASPTSSRSPVRASSAMQ